MIESTESSDTPVTYVALLTGGHDRSYAIGLTRALISLGVHVEVVGSDDIDGPEFHDSPHIEFRNLRGNQREDVSFARKLARLTRYYLRLVGFAVRARPRVFHILWNNKIEWFDRTVLMLLYRMAGRRIVLTAHNVNVAARDQRDSAWNRWTLRIQYMLAHHVFVHTSRMSEDLVRDFGVSSTRISVIPFGINDSLPRSDDVTPSRARQHLGLSDNEIVALFFGQIAPYKGLEYLLDALPQIAGGIEGFRLLIGGRIKEGNGDYGARIRSLLANPAVAASAVSRIEHIPDSEVEFFLKAADVLVLPYTHIFQSGVPFLAYSFGVPVIATDVGSLRDDIVEGSTGFVCKPRSPDALADALINFCSSDLHLRRAETREHIQTWARERYSWSRVAAITVDVYKHVDSSRHPGIDTGSGCSSHPGKGPLP